MSMNAYLCRIVLTMAAMKLFVLLMSFVGFTGAQDDLGALYVARESVMLNETRDLKANQLKLESELKSELKAFQEGMAKDIASLHFKQDSVVQMLEKLTKENPGNDAGCHSSEIRY